MLRPTASGIVHELPVLMRGEPGPLAEWTRQAGWVRAGCHAAVVVAGAGCFGFAIGWWRAPEQAAFTALKLPLILLLTTVGNALLNSMLAPLLGVDLRLRQTFAAILSSFALASVILASFAPLVMFLVWNTPLKGAGEGSDWFGFSILQLTIVAAVAIAGIAANVRLRQMIATVAGAGAGAGRVLFAWLAVNLLLGSQLAWNLRPFIGSPALEVQFLRPNAFEGNFFETVYHTFLRLTLP